MLVIIYRYKWVIAFVGLLMLFGLINRPTINHSALERTGLSKVDKNFGQITSNAHTLPSGTKLKLQQPSDINKASSTQKQYTNVVTNTPLSRKQQANPDLLDANEWRRASATRRIDLAHADILDEMVTDSNSIVRNAAMERLMQLEPEYEEANQIMRSSGDSGHFLPTVLKGLAYENDPIAIQSALEYIGQYGENNAEAKTALDSLSSRTDLDPPTMDFIAELLVENFGQNPSGVQPQMPNRENMNESD